MHKFDVPSYWGPIGGFQFVNLRLAIRSGKKYFLISLLRNVLTYFVARSWVVRAAVNGFDEVSFATRTNHLNFKAIYGVTGPVISDQAVRMECVSRHSRAETRGARRLEVVWCGSVDARKNIKLLLDIAKRAKGKGLNIIFNVVGDGPLLKRSENSSRILGLSVVFHGHLPRPEVVDIFRLSDVVLSTSLSEANTATFFEGLESICIPIALDLDGFSTNITPDIGFLVDTDLPYVMIVDKFVEYLEALSNDGSNMAGLKQNIENQIFEYTWDTVFTKHDVILKGLLASNKD
jgi:glycosyltransferase involved in cell wall biosynthesis